jgi:hypothetical protein
MEKNLEKAFKNAKYEPENTLSNRIWHAILAKEQRVARIKIWAYSIVGAVSFVSLFPVISSLLRQFAESGFSEYLSLAFSDGGSVMLYWKEFVLSLADSLPATSLILSFSLLFVFFLSVRRVARYSKDQLHSMRYA